MPKTIASTRSSQRPPESRLESPFMRVTCANKRISPSRSPFFFFLGTPFVHACVCVFVLTLVTYFNISVVCGSCLSSPQIDATLDAFVKPDVFDQVPMDPNNMVKTGKEVFLVSKQEGRIARVPGVDIIRGLASFRCVYVLSFVVPCVFLRVLLFRVARSAGILLYCLLYRIIPLFLFLILFSVERHR